jgi:ABC-type multidrug transport system fused ATPase/permease subunit
VQTIIQTAATMTLATGLRFLCQVLGGIIVLFYLSWRLTLVMVIPLPLFGLAAWMYSRAVRALSARLQKSLAACTTVAEEAIGGVRLIRSFGREDAERERYNARVDGSYRLGRRMAALWGVDELLIADC